jgi:hypothetical protein
MFDTTYVAIYIPSTLKIYKNTALKLLLFTLFNVNLGWEFEYDI